MYLLLLAVAPAAGLLIYVWNKDKSEKEPLSLLLLLVGLGAVSAIPTIITELIIDAPLTKLFNITEYSSLANDGASYVLYAFLDNFFGVALIEEGFKFLFLYFATRNNKHFDSLFDGMIYAIFVSLGFAALENIFYVVDGGVSVALTRAVMSVPGHMFFAVFMGYYYSMWHIYKLADFAEQGYARNGLIIPRPPKFAYKKYLALALIVPTAVHGFYDFCLSLDIVALELALLAGMIALYIGCFNRIKKMSDADLLDYRLVPLMLSAKYPELVGVISNKAVVPTYKNMSIDEAVAVATQERQQELKEEAEARARAYYQQQNMYSQYPPQYNYPPQYPQYNPQQQPPQYNNYPPQYPQYNPQQQPPQYNSQPPQFWQQQDNNN